MKAVLLSGAGVVGQQVGALRIGAAVGGDVDDEGLFAGLFERPGPVAGAVQGAVQK